MRYEEHTFFFCQVLLDGMEVDKEIKFMDIFGDLESQVRAIRYFTKVNRKRQSILTLQGANTS